MSLTFRPATRADFIEFYNAPPPKTMTAKVAERDGKIVGFGGYYLDGDAAFVFTDQRGMTKREILLGARTVLEMVKPLGLEVVARSDGDNDVALRHFGFEPWGMFYRLKR